MSGECKLCTENLSKYALPRSSSEARFRAGFSLTNRKSDFDLCRSFCLLYAWNLADLIFYFNIFEELCRESQSNLHLACIWQTRLISFPNRHLVNLCSLEHLKNQQVGWVGTLSKTERIRFVPTLVSLPTLTILGFWTGCAVTCSNYTLSFRTMVAKQTKLTRSLCRQVGTNQLTFRPPTWVQLLKKRININASAVSRFTVVWRFSPWLNFSTTGILFCKLRMWMNDATFKLPNSATHVRVLMFGK